MSNSIKMPGLDDKTPAGGNMTGHGLKERLNQLVLGLVGFKVVSDDPVVTEVAEVTENSIAAIRQLVQTLLDIDVVHPELGIKAELQVFARDLKSRVEAGEGEEETNFRPRLLAMYEKYRQYALPSPPFEA